ncbi:MAG TPA: MFS transporter [Ktedonobacterales bacterium]|nr:MFS transporter [Ktedonobacterales bacterium]
MALQIAEREQSESTPTQQQMVPLENVEEERERSEERHFSIRSHLGLSFMWFALNFLFAGLLPLVIPAQILLFVSPGAAGNANQAVFLGGLAALGAVTTLILQPTIGWLSDRTMTRIGRRRPYVLAGAVVLLAGLAMLAMAHSLIPFIAALFLVVCGNCVSSTAYQGLVPDLVPERQRGAASGYFGLMTILGTVGSLAVAALLLNAGGKGHTLAAGISHGAVFFYTLTGAVLVVGVLVTMCAVHEVPLSAARTTGAGDVCKSRRERIAKLWIEPWRHANFTWVFLTRLCVMLGLALFMTYIEYYFAQVDHVGNFIAATAINAVMALLGAVASSLVLGILSDRLGRVPVVFVSTLFMALTTTTFVLLQGNFPLWPLGILFGLGYGGFTSVDWALAIDALPSLNEAGKDMGLWGMASTLPGVFAPVVGGLVIYLFTQLGATALGYRCVFGVASLCLLLGAVFVLKVRVGTVRAAKAVS